MTQWRQDAMTAGSRQALHRADGQHDISTAGEMPNGSIPADRLFKSCTNRSREACSGIGAQPRERAELVPATRRPDVSAKWTRTRGGRQSEEVSAVRSTSASDQSLNRPPLMRGEELISPHSNDETPFARGLQHWDQRVHVGREQEPVA